GCCLRCFPTRRSSDLSAHIQESDAQWANQKGKRSGAEPVEPLYTVADAEEAIKHIVTCEYGTRLQIEDGVRIRFVDAGHLLGSRSEEHTSELQSRFDL